MPNILFILFLWIVRHVYQRGHYLSIAFLSPLTGQKNLQDKSLYNAIYLRIFEDKNCAVQQGTGNSLRRREKEILLNFMPVENQSMGGIIGRDANGNPVSRDDPYLEALHLPAEPRCNGNPILKGDDVVSPTPCLCDLPFEFCEIIFRQMYTFELPLRQLELNSGWRRKTKIAAADSAAALITSADPFPGGIEMALGVYQRFRPPEPLPPLPPPLRLAPW